MIECTFVWFDTAECNETRHTAAVLELPRVGDRVNLPTASIDLDLPDDERIDLTDLLVTRVTQSSFAGSPEGRSQLRPMIHVERDAEVEHRRELEAQAEQLNAVRNTLSAVLLVLNTSTNDGVFDLESGEETVADRDLVAFHTFKRAAIPLLIMESVDAVYVHEPSREAWSVNELRQGKRSVFRTCIKHRYKAIDNEQEVTP